MTGRWISGRSTAGGWVTRRILAFQRRLDAFVEAVAQFDRRVDVALPGKRQLGVATNDRCW